MTVELIQGSVASKAFETIELLKINLHRGKEASYNSSSVSDKIISAAAKAAFILALGSIVTGSYCAAKALFTFSAKPLRRTAGCTALTAVTCLAFKYLLLPYLNELNRINLVKSIYRGFVNDSFASWQRNIFLSTAQDQDITTVLHELLVCLTAKEGTQEALRGSRYLTLLNMPKDQAIKAVALAKIVQSVLAGLKYLNGLFKSVNGQVAKLDLNSLQKNSRIQAAALEKDLEIAELEDGLNLRIQYIISCLKDDVTRLRLAKALKASIQLSDLDIPYCNSLIEEPD